MRIRLIPVLFSVMALTACDPSGRLDFEGSAFTATPTISGPAEIVDGDSLKIGDISIRLFGIDAFEGQQACERNGREWRCGDEAANKLADLVARSTIVCEQRDIDRYDRTVARCTAGAVDLAAELASAGLALAYREYSSDYVDEEAEARSAERGAWAGTFEDPWDWRHRESSGPSVTSDPAPPNSFGSGEGGECLIKGNISREGERIYHLPGTSNYEPTVIDESKGERWFCSESDALGAGWRAPRAR